MPGQDKVPIEAVAVRCKGREAHAHKQRDTGLLRQHLHRAEGRDSGQHLVKGCPDVPVRVSEMLVQITGPGAGVDLVPVGRAIDHAVADRSSGPILLNGRGGRMDRHATYSVAAYLAGPPGEQLTAPEAGFAWPDRSGQAKPEQRWQHTTGGITDRDPNGDHEPPF